MAKLTIAELLTSKGESAFPVPNCRLGQIPIQTTEFDRAIHVQPCRRPSDTIGWKTVRLTESPIFIPFNRKHLSFIHRGFCSSSSCECSLTRIPGETGV